MPPARERRQPGARIAILLAIVAECVAAYVDLNTGTAPLFEVFYILPLSLAAWFSGERMALVLALAAGIIRSSAHTYGLGAGYSVGLHVYNAGEATILFICVGYFVARIRSHIDRLSTADEHLKQALAERDLALSAARREAEALAHKQTFLLTLFDTIPDLIWLKDLDGVYLACNSKFERFFGHPENEIVGKTDYDFMDRELAEFFRNNDHLAVETDGARMNEEWLTFAADGYHGLFETIKTPMKTAEGKLIGVLGIARDISRQHEAFEALREREEIYSSIVGQASDGIVLIDPETYDFVEFNDAACQMLGHDRDAFARLKLFDLPADHDPDQLRALMAATLARGKGHFELRQRHRDGSTRDCWISYRVLRIGGRTLVNAIWHDLTERKASEAALREERQLRATIMEAIPGICYTLDHNRCLHYWNQTFERLMERSPEDLKGINALDFFEGDDRRVIHERIVEAFTTGAKVEVEATLVIDNDRRIPFLFNNRRIEMGGQPVLVGVGIDVSALRAAWDALRRLNSELEQRVRERTRELQAANAQLIDTQFALDSVGIGITWADFATGRFIHANRFSAEFLGYSLDELLQLRVWDIDPNFPPEAFAQITRQIRERGHLQFETEQLTKDNRRLPVEMNIYYHAGNGVTPPKLIAFMSDIARRKDAEAALRQAKEASEAASAAKSEFLANMSHEIRTPLNAILGLNFLLKKEDPSSVQLERLTKMEVAGRHLLSLINDILDLSKIEAGRMDLEHTSFHLSAVLDNVASIVRDAAANKGLTLEVDTDGVPLWLWGDVTRLRQSLLNFASNAVKFTERGKICLRSLLLREQDAALQVRFEVEDTGIGLTPEQQTRMFQAFEQAEDSTARKFGGTGLGLALTRRLVELMGGDVGLHSIPGVGSTFWFSVPLQCGHGPMPILVPTGVQGDAESRLSTRHLGARLLLAEDNPINVEVVLEMLHAVGIDVAVAANGREAVERARQQTFDLILMDMQMPEIGGIEATRLIRGLPQWADRPIIALTANAFAEDRRACLEAGMNDVLTKPVEPGLLYATILHWLAPTMRGERAPAPVQNQRVFDASDDALVILALRTRDGIDVNAGLAMLRGKTDKYLALVRQLVDRQSLQMLEMTQVLDAGDQAAAGRMAHSLKGSAATLGLAFIAERALRLEQLLTAENDPGVRRDAIQMTIAEVLAALHDIKSVVGPAPRPVMGWT